MIALGDGMRTRVRAWPLEEAASGVRTAASDVGTPLAPGFRGAPNPVASHIRGTWKPRRGPDHQGGPVGRSQEGWNSSAGQDAQEADAGGRKATGRVTEKPLLQAVVTGNRPDAGLAAGPERALTWAGEPLNAEVGILMNQGASWTPSR